MYHPTSRVLAVLEWLQAQPGISGSELAARLEVDRRTIRRYIVMLQDIGIPVEAERGPNGGYSLRPGYRLPPLMLGDDEALAVMLGLMAARRGGMTEPEPLERAIAKIERVLPIALRDQVQAVEAVTRSVRPVDVPAPPGPILLMLGTAVRQHRRVQLEYRAGAVTTERGVDAYGLVTHWDRWYLTGYCHLRQAIRVFRVDRIGWVRVEAQTFTLPRRFDPLRTVLDALASSRTGWPVDLILHTSLADAKRRVPAGTALLTTTQGGVRLRANVDNLDWLARVLLALGCSFTVLAPVELRRALRAVGEEAIAAAKRKTASRLVA